MKEARRAKRKKEKAAQKAKKKLQKAPAAKPSGEGDGGKGQEFAPENIRKSTAGKGIIEAMMVKILEVDKAKFPNRPVFTAHGSCRMKVGKCEGKSWENIVAMSFKYFQLRSLGDDWGCMGMFFNNFVINCVNAFRGFPCYPTNPYYPIHSHTNKY